jgi:hypothetical protein
MKDREMSLRVFLVALALVATVSVIGFYFTVRAIIWLLGW